MGANVLRRHFPYKKRCDSCHKPSHDLYVITLGAYTYGFHAPTEVSNAQHNFEEKMKAGLPQTPSQPLTQEEPNDMIRTQEEDGIEKF